MKRKDTTKSSTPQEIVITPRNPRFNFGKTSYHWLSTPVISQYFNALSIFVPLSEKIVIQILRKERETITDEKLKAEITALIKQEGLHAKLHRQTNQLLTNAGFTAIPWLIKVQEFGYNALLKLLPAKSIPAAFEHFTSALAWAYIEHRSEWTGNKENELIDFLDWHAMEELEHQAVCLDVYNSGKKEKLPMLALSIYLVWLPLTLISLYGTQVYLLAKDGTLKKKQGRKDLMRWIKTSAPILWRGVTHYQRSDHETWTQKRIGQYTQLKHLVEGKTSLA